MRGTTRRAWLAVPLLACAAACGKSISPTAQPAPGYGGGVPRHPTSGRGGAAHNDDAGGDYDAGARAGAFEVLVSECENVTVGDAMEVTSTGHFTNAISSPADLPVTRVETTWDGDCSAPMIRITLSDGRCPAGTGHEVVFVLDALAIAEGRIGRGENTLVPEPGDFGLRARYRRPKSFDPLGTGEWGTCVGAHGTVEFPDAPSTDRRSELRARFFMALTPCDEITEGPQEVDGAFDVTLTRGVDDVCPAT